MKEKSSRPRIHSMDSMRGLASLQVVLAHSFMMTIGFYNSYISSHVFQDSIALNALTFTPLHFLWAGHEAVIFFFVMSGFVVSIPYYEDNHSNYQSFFIKRIFRIYFPYLVALSFGFLLNSIFNGHARIQNLSPWFNDIFISPITPQDYFDFIVLLKGNFHNVVTSLWSLPVEIKLSLLIPFLIIPIKRLNTIASVLLPFINITFYHIGKRLGLEQFWPDFTLFYYFTFFLTGTVLAKYFVDILVFANSLRKSALFTILSLSICLYISKWLVIYFPENFKGLLYRIPFDYLITFSSVLILILGMSSKFSQVLNKKYLVELGKISFSLYLIHPIIISSIGFTLGNIVPLYFLVPLAIMLSLLASIPFHYMVELPLQKFGRLLGDKLN